MEPFRILIDRWADSFEFNEFDFEAKHKMLEILDRVLIINEEKRRLDDCIMLYTRSVFKAIQTQNLNVIKFCKIK